MRPKQMKRKEVFEMKKLLSLLLSAAMLVSLAAGLSLTASAAAATPAESAVTEMTVAENTVFVYAPKSELTVSSTCTAPCFIVYGSGAYTAQSAKAEAESSGLAALAAAEGATIVFVNPQGDSWGEADLGVYSALIDMYSNSSTNKKCCFTFFHCESVPQWSKNFDRISLLELRKFFGSCTLTCHTINKANLSFFFIYDGNGLTI